MIALNFMKVGPTQGRDLAVEGRFVLAQLAACFTEEPHSPKNAPGTVRRAPRVSEQPTLHTHQVDKLSPEVCSRKIRCQT